jgi:hypothetical protein
MRKLICIAIVALAAMPCAFGLPHLGLIHLRAFAPIDIQGSFSETYLGDTESWAMDTGYGEGAEVLISILPGLRAGAGCQYLMQRPFAEYSDYTIGFIPAYGVIQYSLSLPIVHPYAIVRAGYGIFKANDDFLGAWTLKNGLYASAGAGLSVDIPITDLGVFVEALYALDYAGASRDSMDYDMDYRRFEVCAGLSYSL